MIITCPCKEKKFEIDASLIPNKGRTLQCGSCGKKWFYNPNIEIPANITPQIKTDEKIKKNENLSKIIDNKLENEDKPILSKEKLQNIQKNKDGSESSKSNIFGLGKILSYLVVIIITFIALIVILDTFKYQLSNIFPNLELLLYNLFESLKDVNLFVKDLFI